MWTNMHNSRNSLFTICDGHGPGGHLVARYATDFFSGEPFVRSLIDAAKSDKRDKISAYTELFDTGIKEIEKRLGEIDEFKAIIETSGSTIVVLFIDNEDFIVVVGLGDSSVIGVRKNTYELEHLFKHHDSKNVSCVLYFSIDANSPSILFCYFYCD